MRAAVLVSSVKLEQQRPLGTPPGGLLRFRTTCERWPGHSHHLAARCASDRGQPAPARGVCYGTERSAV